MLLSKGAGLNSTQTGGWYPPDQAIAAAPGYVFEGNNNLAEVFSTAYGLKYGPWTPDQIFASVKQGTDFFSDPQITFDAERSKYVITWLEINGTTGNDYIDFAITKTSTPSPLTNYRVYQLAATAAGADNFCDYDTLGYDYWAAYVTCADFSVSGGSFLGNTTFAIDLNFMFNGTGIVGWFWNNIYTDVSCGASCVEPAYRLSPTMEDGVPQAEWITATDVGWLGGNVSTNLTACAVTNSHALESANAPTLTCAYTSLPTAYDDSIGAAQPGTTAQVFAGDGYKQVAYRNGQLYFAMPIAITCNTVLENGILWGAIDPQLTTFAVKNRSGSTASTPTTARRATGATTAPTPTCRR